MKFAGLKALGVALLAATSTSAAALAPRADDDAPRDLESLSILTKAADSLVAPALANKNSALSGSPRSLTRLVRQIVTPFVWPNSTYYHDETLLPHIEEMLDVLVQRQHCDGTYSVGNRHSPPDTGFLIEDFGIMVRILERDGHEASQPIADTIRDILSKAGPGLAAGGIHTPNHRWKICGALSRISNIIGDESLLDRVDEWLAEGIDIDVDGIYSERSPNYYSAVSNPSLLTVAHELNKTELIEHVRKNLELTIEHAEPNGEVETVMSRRQDQTQAQPDNIQAFYVQFRELALRDKNGRFAAMARLLEERYGSRLGDYLAPLIERPELAALLPEPETPWADYKKHYAKVGLFRERRGKLTAAAFGGSDWYANGEQTAFYNRFASGLSTNPTLFRAWNGKLALDGVRLVPQFFTMGHFRSNGLSVSDGGVVTLGSEMEVPYYLPMPADQRDANGEYALGRSVADGRFYAALDFANRPTSMRRLKTDVVIKPTDAGYDLEFEVSGERDVEVTIELTFREGGAFGGAMKQLTDTNGVKTFHLVEGEGSYSLGEDTITFGPGNGEGLVSNDAGEQYSWHAGSLVLRGHKVFVTGVAPFQYTLNLGFQ
ncbi:hypothetical protein F5X68DRAFT_250391 [Plectosphaerella plurivora]|uniref:Uncharacterized protein n=1 Tax=Plectosphaerella plurivora TaxID=936078 RepID=A0A9P8VFX8_9PEZI|nr:hypothetical protein F5X68DRAFT_250391 [Plectosphaerella plurivora]